MRYTLKDLQKQDFPTGALYPIIFSLLNKNCIALWKLLYGFWHAQSLRWSVRTLTKQRSRCTRIIGWVKPVSFYTMDICAKTYTDFYTCQNKFNKETQNVWGIYTIVKGMLKLYYRDIKYIVHFSSESMSTKCMSARKSLQLSVHVKLTRPLTSMHRIHEKFCQFWWHT